MNLDQPLWLLLLPLVLVPWVLPRRAQLDYPGLAGLPGDSLSRRLAGGLKTARSLVMGLLIIALSGPHWPEHSVERIGQGAQMVLLLDRSRSMDQAFATATPQPLGAELPKESKGRVARRLLTEFAARRRNDYFAMMAFSNQALPIMPFTNKPELVQAAIEAGNSGKGLSETDIGKGLAAAVRLFEGQPYDGSRIVLLISDGGALLDPSTQNEIRRLFRYYRAALYWIYLRSRHSKGLDLSGAESEQYDDDVAPERALYRFFSTLETPFRAYTADNPKALEEAVAAVDRLQLLPLRYQETISRRDLQRWFYLAALILLAPAVLAHYGELRRWHN